MLHSVCLIDVEAPDDHSLSESMIELSQEEVFVEAGGTAEVGVIVDLTLSELGLYGGYIIAESADEKMLIHTPIGFHKEPEMYDLTVKGVLDGPLFKTSRASVMNVEDTRIFSMYNASFTSEEETDIGELTFRVPPGTYNVNGVLTSRSEPNQRHATENIMINIPEVEVTDD